MNEIEAKKEETAGMGKALDLKGQRFGRLTVVRVADKRARRGNTIWWLCKCSCGKWTTVRSDHLRFGCTKSCGCLRRDLHTKHGRSGTPTHKIWTGLFDRCENPNNTGYQYYGGRGIKVCERWHSFENFFADMGERPEGLTIV